MSEIDGTQVVTSAAAGGNKQTLPIDLRSDTITLPTEAMYTAMAEAELGDDSRDGDPTVQALEEKSARMLGKEAGLLVASGTMGNLVSLLGQTHAGEEIIVPAGAHIYGIESGGYAAVGGLSIAVVPGEKGVLDPDQVEEAVRDRRQPTAPLTRLIAVENSHNMAGGTVTGTEVMAGLRAVADRHDLRLHVDGARIFNAAVALGVPVSSLVEHADSVTFCLSKGLSGPVGSLVVGSQSFITTVRRKRQMLGGALRQGGIIAAAGLVALDTMIERLGEDHRRARWLAEGLAAIDGVEIDLETVQTNIVRVHLGDRDISASAIDAPTLVAGLAKRGIRVQATGRSSLRLVTHRHITDADVEATLHAFGEFLG